MTAAQELVNCLQVLEVVAPAIDAQLHPQVRGIIQVKVNYGLLQREGGEIIDIYFSSRYLILLSSFVLSVFMI